MCGGVCVAVCVWRCACVAVCAFCRMCAWRCVCACECVLRCASPTSACPATSAVVSEHAASTVTTGCAECFIMALAPLTNVKGLKGALGSAIVPSKMLSSDRTFFMNNCTWFLQCLLHLNSVFRSTDSWVLSVTKMYLIVSRMP